LTNLSVAIEFVASTEAKSTGIITCIKEQLS